MWFGLTGNFSEAIFAFSTFLTTVNADSKSMESQQNAKAWY